MEHLGHVLKGYLECAKWADCPEESPNARFCKSAIESAAKESEAVMYWASRDVQTVDHMGV